MPVRPHVERTMPIVILAVALLLALVAAPTASAQTCQGRPGASAIQQYCEAIPEATGGSQRPGGSSQNGSSQNDGSDAPSGAQSELQDAGQDGQAVLGLVAASGGSDDSGGSSSGGSSGSSGGADPGSGSQSSGESGGAPTDTNAKRAEGGVLDAVASSVSSGTTVGDSFAGILVGMAALIAAFGWITMRRRRTP